MRARQPSRLHLASLLSVLSLLGGCAVYQPAPVVLAEGTVSYSTPPATVVAPAPVYPAPVYPVAPYPLAPYYIGPPVSLDLWFGHGGGHYRGWGGHYHGRGWGHGHRHGGAHRGWGGRRR
ncbi:hypothetical protein [Massilia sp. DWR3-1-1]|uniref:hypothetical protein n=1 Tax=Massilia sp. DWR3-1-1 TaxID=2804559 RepID=UPI003CFACE95